MSNILNVKVDVRKLDKSRFFEGKEDKNGHKPLYADLVLFPKKEVGQYGDTHFVTQSKKKDEEVQMPIIGNATERGSKAPAPQHAKPAATPAPGVADDDSVPF